MVRVLDERDPQAWVLKALREAGGSLLSEFYGLDDEDLCRRVEGEDWCLKEVAAHLRDAEELALAQLTAIAEAKPGPLPTWDVDVLPLERDYQSADLDEALAEFRGLRRETTFALWGATDAGWERSAQHPYRGTVTLGEIARELAQHDLEHLWQVRRIKERLSEATPVEDQE